jgi:hypothetical protein
MAQLELTPAASHRLPPPHAPGGPLRATRVQQRAVGQDDPGRIGGRDWGLQAVQRYFSGEFSFLKG